MNEQGAIGVFDSGIGGLTVFSKLVRLLPNEDYVYYGDTKNLPYGSKSKAELLVITRRIFDFFAGKRVKAVVMACNTTSALVYEELKDAYDFKLYPIIQTSMKGVMARGYERVAVFATQGTIESGAYAASIKVVNSRASVVEVACPEFVPMVESGRCFGLEDELIVRSYLDRVLGFEPQAVVLGCTHYPYLLDVFSKFANRELFIDPAEFFVEYVKQDLAALGLLSSSGSANREFYVSMNAAGFMERGKIFYTMKELPKLVFFDTVKK